MPRWSDDMRRLCRDVCAGSYATPGENYLADKLMELARLLGSAPPMVLYHPPGQSLVGGVARDNSAIARELLAAFRAAGDFDVALPDGWALVPLLGDVTLTEETPG